MDDKEKDYKEMVEAVEKYLKKHCNPYTRVIASQELIEVTEIIDGRQTTFFDLLD